MALAPAGSAFGEEADWIFSIAGARLDVSHDAACVRRPVNKDMSNESAGQSTEAASG
jgi:hypothetical protein